MLLLYSKESRTNQICIYTFLYLEIEFIFYNSLDDPPVFYNIPDVTVSNLETVFLIDTQMPPCTEQPYMTSEKNQG